jgi:hypothetical protein
MKGVGISKDVNKQQTEGPKAATPDCKIPEKKNKRGVGCHRYQLFKLGKAVKENRKALHTNERICNWGGHMSQMSDKSDSVRYAKRIKKSLEWLMMQKCIQQTVNCVKRHRRGAKDHKGSQKF